MSPLATLALSLIVHQQGDYRNRQVSVLGLQPNFRTAVVDTEDEREAVLTPTTGTLFKRLKDMLRFFKISARPNMSAWTQGSPAKCLELNCPSNSRYWAKAVSVVHVAIASGQFDK